jgi:hypothetical protein
MLRNQYLASLALALQQQGFRWRRRIFSRGILINATDARRNSLSSRSCTRDQRGRSTVRLNEGTKFPATYSVSELSCIWLSLRARASSSGNPLSACIFCSALRSRVSGKWPGRLGIAVPSALESKITQLKGYGQGHESVALCFGEPIQLNRNSRSIHQKPATPHLGLEQIVIVLLLFFLP